MNRLLILPVLFLTMLVGNPAYSADFQKGVDAYDRGDYAAALREWKPLAEQGHASAQFNLGNFMRTLALPKEVQHWSLTTLREKLVKIGAKVVRHGRYVTFQLAEVAVPRSLFQQILELIDDLRPRPVPA